MVSFLPILSEEVLVMKLVLGDLCYRGCGSDSDWVGSGRAEATSFVLPLIPRSLAMFNRGLETDGARPRATSSLPEGKWSSSGFLAALKEFRIASSSCLSLYLGAATPAQ